MFLLLVCVLGTPCRARAQESLVTLDPAQTRIDYMLGATLHTVHGTFLLEAGMIRFDPATGAASGALIVDATSGASGNGSRDRRMHKEIIESQQFPEIVFTPHHVAGQLEGLSAGQGPYEVQVSGTFRLLGQDHDFTIPVALRPSGSQLQASSDFTIPYIQWGLKNPNTLFLHVTPTVEIDVHAVGRLAPASSVQ
jgi:polyisoprenoid-binding protein YceI